MIEYQKYTRDFFSELEENSYKSALNVIPVVEELFRPKSVIDVGCGTGAWLKVWRDLFKIEDLMGIEGPYVEKETLLIPADKIVFKDLKKPIDINRRFDLAMSLEVAEHIPDANADIFVSSLVSVSDVILFSAALPGQKGTYHINEQYPEYWAQRFKKHDFLPVDCVRTRIWNNSLVEYWYQQNVIVFIKKDKIKDYPELDCFFNTTNPSFLTRVHPYLFELNKEHIRRTETMWGYLNWKWYMFKQKYIKRNAKQ